MDSLLVSLLLLLLLTKPSEFNQFSIQTDEFFTVILSTSSPLDHCSVCDLTEKADAACTSSLEIKPSKNINVNFTCSEPEKSFSVLIQSSVECTKTACTPAYGNVPASLLPGFNRKFEWKLRATAEAILSVKFPKDGLRELAKEEDCTKGYIYSVNSPSSDGSAQSQSYCTNGSVTHLELPNQATMFVQVNQQHDQDLKLFTVTPESMQNKGQTRMVIPDRDTTLIISRKEEGSECSVCMDGTCGSKLSLAPNQNRNVTFSCAKPQDFFNVEIIRSLDCLKGCSYDMIDPQTSYFPDFNRLFSWDMKVSADKAFQLEFPAPGLRQIQSSESCPGKHTYRVLMYPRAGTVNLGTFCQNGPITHIQVLWRGRMTLEVPRDTILSTSFKFSAASGSDQAVVDAVLPRGQSNTDFFSPQSIPSNDIMKWNFFLPPKHNFTVQFLDYTNQKCQSKVVKVIYNQSNREPVEKTLTDNQLINYSGNFSLTLVNCDAVRQAGVSGLSLNFRVSVFRGGYPEVCKLDLQSNQGLSLQINKNDPDSLCEMSMDSVVQQNISVPPGSKPKLSFLDCSENDLLLSATKTIECQSPSSCPADKIALTIPSFDSCTLLHSPLHQVNWVMRVPWTATVELRSPEGNLHQFVPGQDSNCPMSLIVSEVDGANIGKFCSFSSQGTISRVQISSNVTITALTSVTRKSSLEKDTYLNVYFGSEIKEKLIYSISPSVSTPVYLITPNWPGAMMSASTVSWIINVPEQYSADLAFVNISWPECSRSDSIIEIQELGSEQGQSLRKGNLLKNINIQNSFYLNMSSCEPQQDQFAVLSKISLKKNSNKLLGIILGVVGALLAILISILIAVCLVVRKPKRNDSSIYIPKGAVSLPGDFTFPKTQTQNEPRVYESIDDTMVYGHLLEQDGYTERGPSHYNGHKVDMYRPFISPMDKNDEPDVGSGTLLPPSESFIPSRPRTPLGPLDSAGYEDRRLKDNELGTFKNTGEINVIRLSAAEPWPEPPEPIYDQAI